MMKFNLRYVTPAGLISEALPDTVEMSLSPIFCKPGTVTFSYPANGVNFSLLAEGTEIAVFRAGVEVGELRCIIEAVSGDDADLNEDGAIWQFTARTNLALFDGAVVYPALWPITLYPFQGFVERSAGYVIKTIVTAAQSRGALTGIILDFDEFLDSAGAAWNTEITINFAAGITYTEVWNKLVELQMMEGQMVGRHLKMYNLNALGVDRSIGATPVLFARGRDLKESPRSTSNRDLRTTVLIAGDNGVYLERTDAAAIISYGRRESYLSQSGIDDSATLQIIGDNKLGQVNRPKMEKTHGLIFGQSTPEPITDFSVGDWVLSDVGKGMEKLRVKQWVISIDSNDLMEGSVVLNDLFQEIAEYLEKRVDDIIGGDVVVGPSQPGTNDLSIPKAPASVGLTSAAYFDNQGNAFAQLTITWAAVIENTDNTPISDLNRYAIRWKYNTDSEYRMASWVEGTQTVTYISGLLPNTAVTVQVAAEDRSEHISSWQTNSTTTAYDLVAPPKPSSPVVTAKLGSLFIAWDGKDSTATNMPADLELVQVHVSSGGTGFTPSASTLKDTFLPGGGVSVVGNLTYGTQYWVKLIAQDYTGNLSVVSDNSGTTTATVVQVVHTDVGGNVIDFTNITFKDIGNLVADGSFELQASADIYNPLPFVEVVSGISGSPSTKVLRIDPWVQNPSVNRNVATIVSNCPASAGQRVAGIVSYMATTGYANIVYLNLVWKDAVGATISESVVGGPFFTVADNTWKLRQAQATSVAPAGTASFDVNIVQASNASASTGFFYYDQIEIRLQMGTVLIEDLAVNNAKIANLAVNDAKIADLSVGKITAGTIVTNWLLGASIRTAASGARVELNATGLHAFNSGNVEVVTVSSTTGNISAYGTFNAGSPSSTMITLTPSGPGSNPAIIFKNPSLSWFQDPVMFVETSDLGIHIRSGQRTGSSNPYTHLILSDNYWVLGVLTAASSFASSIDSNGAIVLTSGGGDEIQLRSGSLSGGASNAGIGLFGELMVNYNDGMMLSTELIYTAGAAGAGGTLNWSWGPTMPYVPRHSGPGFWSDGRIIVGTYKSLTTTGGSVEMWNMTGAGTAANSRCWVSALRTD